MPLHRRTPAWTPADLPPEIVLGWYDAKNHDFQLDVGALPAWTDRTGRDRRLTQPTGSAKPTFVLHGRHGLPALRFDGGDRCFNSALGNPFGGLTKGYMACVMSSVSANVDKYLISAPFSASANGVDLGLNATAVQCYLKTNTITATALTASLGWNDGAIYLLEQSIDLDLVGDERTVIGGDETVAKATIGGATISAAHSQFVVGGFSSTLAVDYTGDLYEVLICSRPLAGREGDLYRRYCQQRWGAAVKST